MQLKEYGVDLLERKDGIQIRISEYDLDMHWREALSEYAGKHEDHCTEFARTVLKQTNRPDLLDHPGPTRSEFIEYLETGLVERDFTDLF